MAVTKVTKLQLLIIHMKKHIFPKRNIHAPLVIFGNSQEGNVVSFCMLFNCSSFVTFVTRASTRCSDWTNALHTPSQALKSFVTPVTKLLPHVTKLARLGDKTAVHHTIGDGHAGRTARRQEPCQGRPAILGKFEKQAVPLGEIRMRRAPAHDLASVRAAYA
jgi:hypothetical protein